MSWLALMLIGFFTLDALRLRRRLATFKVVEVDLTEEAPEHYRLITAPGVVIDESVARSAAAFAHAEGIEVLDLIPENMPTLRAMETVRAIDPIALRTDPFSAGRSAGHALLVAQDVWTRTEMASTMPHDPVAFASVATRLKRYACTTTDLAIVPGIQAIPEDLHWRVARLRATGGGAALRALASPLLVVGLLALALMHAPVWGVLALLAYHLQPLIVLGNQRLRPLDLSKVTLARLPLEGWRWLRTLLKPHPGPIKANASEAKRPEYAVLLADGVERFFEPRCPTCPLCGSADLRLVLSVPDLIQHKPGHFSLDRCESCGHIFQNPRLTLEGLNFYYKDFYDGLGEETFNMIFGRGLHGYLARARLLLGRAEPSRWLDVGAGYGHFCCAARQVWPKTAFDGVELSAGIEEAARRRWVDTGYRGLFPELAPKLSGTYDVVSMYHYLEHTREPQAEIAAAHQVLRHEGFLLIEMPDPESRIGRLFGRFWLPWLQPQHQHLLSAGNLAKLLRQNGFEPVLWQRAEPHQPADILFAIVIFLGLLAPDPNSPWRPPASSWQRLRYAVVWMLGAPIALLGWMLDFVLMPLCRRPKLSNCYRVLAQHHRTAVGQATLP